MHRGPQIVFTETCREESLRNMFVRPHDALFTMLTPKLQTAAKRAEEPIYFRKKTCGFSHQTTVLD